MKISSTKIAVASIALVAFAIACAASDYSTPSDVTKTGLAISSGVYYDSSLGAPVPTNSCTGYASNKVVNSTSGTLSVSRAANTTGSVSCQVQNLAYAANANDGVGKWVISGTVTWASGTNVNEAINFSRLFATDIDKDGISATAGNNEYAGITVTINGDGSGSVTRGVFLTNQGIQRSTTFYGGGYATASVPFNVSHNDQWASSAGSAVSGTGAHTFTITITAGASAGLDVTTVVIDGTTVKTSTAAAGLAGLGTAPNVYFCLASIQPVGGSNTGCDGSPTSEIGTPFGILTNSAVPVNAMWMTITGHTTALGTQNYPTISGLKLNK